jgi:nicotinamide-nucleotide amidase
MKVDDDSLYVLAESCGKALHARRLTLATAESCTGGWIAQTLTRVAGSSRWFEAGLATYSNASKQALLGVTLDALQRYGAVSEEVASQMASGALAAVSADVSVAVTGIAGPDGGTAEKPVGTVCFAWAIGQECESETVHFDGDRDTVRRCSVAHALNGLSQRLRAK